MMAMAFDNLQEIAVSITTTFISYVESIKWLLLYKAKQTFSNILAKNNEGTLGGLPYEKGRGASSEIFN